jgi:hypothetical protein
LPFQQLSSRPIRVCLVPLPIGPGDAVSADFGELGRVTLRFTE